MITKMKIACLASAAMMLAAPAAFAQDSYDGYCYAKDNKTTGTVIGAVAGGAIGSQVSKNERGLGAIIGAVAGGALGRKIASDSTKCANGEYYSYQSGDYTPRDAPDGHEIVYFKTRPKTSAYSTVYYDADRRTSPGYASNNQGQPYYSGNQAAQGWKDQTGTWRNGRPVALGWKDSRGRWHQGEVVAYGWKDSSGRWHEDRPSGYGQNNGN